MNTKNDNDEFLSDHDKFLRSPRRTDLDPTILNEINAKMKQEMLDKMTRWERVKYHYTDRKAALAVWLDEPVEVNRWHMIWIAAVAAFGVGYILFSFAMGNVAECTVL